MHQELESARNQLAPLQAQLKEAQDTLLKARQDLQEAVKKEAEATARAEAAAKDAAKGSALENELANARAESMSLQTKIQQLTAQVKTAPAQTGVSEEEFKKVKDKLEAAEKILRMVHGAG